MLRTILACLTLFVLLAGAPPARGDERILDFLHGLRARDDFDLAILFLEQLEKRDNLPADLKTVLPYEKAVTFLESVKTERSPDKQSKNLDSARGFLEEFLKANPDHPLSAQANSELANVYLGKARVEIIQSRNPNNSPPSPPPRKRPAASSPRRARCSRRPTTNTKRSTRVPVLHRPREGQASV